MATVRLTIDGKQVEVEAGRRLLDVAREHGVEIPTLCHDPRLAPFGACRLCLVEVRGARGPIAACGTEVTDGMEVTTNSDVIADLRRMGLELLLSDHYGDCIAPCQLACPAGIDIQGYIAMIADGRMDEALQLIKERMPLPAVCGRVCPKFCEDACRRTAVEDPVAICWLKRFAADEDLAGANWQPELKPATGKRIAVIGSGPAGLTAAYYLAIAGHSVTLLEAADQLGGMMRYGIPAYRLPRNILDAEIRTITRLCDEVRIGAALGRDYTLASLREEGFDAIFIGVGAQNNQDMGIAGEDLDGVEAGVHFLRRIVAGEQVTVGDRVCVVGGGNTAMDAARNALRLGTGTVTIVYRRSEQEMPASHEEVEQARDEGVEFMLQTNPTEFIGDNGRLTAVRCVKMELGEPDASGRRRPVPIEGSEFELPVDQAITAIGQQVDPAGLDEVTCDRWHCVCVDEGTYQASLAMVFSAGDCVTGPRTVVEAVGAARRAAESIDQYLAGEPVVPSVTPYNSTRGELDELDPAEYEDRPRIARSEMPMRPAAERKHDYEEIELGFARDVAMSESERCLSCGCEDVFDCRLQDLATEYGATNRFGRGSYQPKPAAEHPLVVRDAQKCILCGNCVRICAEVQDVAALGFVSRAFQTRVSPTMELPLEETLCESCTQCVSTCPTGALTTRVSLPQPGPFRTETVETSCPRCSLGCELDVEVSGNRAVRVRAPLDGIVSRGNLCKQGAVGFRIAGGPHRLTTPMVRTGGQLTAATREEAIARAADGLRRASETAVLVSGRATTEQAYAAAKLARVALNTNNVDGLVSDRRRVLTEMIGSDRSTAGLDALDRADLILLYGADLAADYPVLANRVRSLASEGAKLAIIGGHRSKLDRLAGATVGVNPRRAPGLLAFMLDYVLRYDLTDREFVDAGTVGFDELSDRLDRISMARVTGQMWTKPEKVIDILHLYLRAKNPVIVTGPGVSDDELGLLVNLAAVTGNMGSDAGLMVLRHGGNAMGLLEAGVSPDLLPGQRSLTDADVAAGWGVSIGSDLGIGAADIRRSGVNGLLIVDTDEPAAGGYPTGEFTVLVTPCLSEAAAVADVVLPAAAWIESEGTFRNAEGRQRVARPVTAARAEDPIAVLSDLARALGRDLGLDTVDRAAAELAGLTRDLPVEKIRLFTDLPPVDDVPVAGD